ncbi:DNA-binding transcriptional regulator, LysR family [Ferrimonas sediminum]|uniref:DNA-binding transcriptional regulator, LysR family n=1 Tax=Ferrimonas sediminum TaxID=718193 RepID=A0A1G8X874_9GAMM|nr:LysR family transcriptional regulator [Ferrimonas sediminum]SDJ85940.1 DNA-binding transcriptional regulator, LysR family [Ferrimonas sediminum]
MNIELSRYLPAFISAAQTHSFSDAARKLGVSPAAISKSIKSLEVALGVRLFHRTTHDLSLTDEGRAFARKVAPVVNELSDILATAQSFTERPSGRLRVSLPYSYGREYVLPLVRPFLDRYPEIELDLRFEDRVVDMVKEGIDVAIGNHLQADSRLVARTLGPVKLVTLASPDFLHRYGIPNHPDDLDRFNCIRFRMASSQRLVPWTFCSPDGQAFSKDQVKSNVSTTNVELGLELAKDGIGITLAAAKIAQPYLNDGSLIQILKDYCADRPPFMIYYASNKQLAPKTRVFIDFVISHLVPK